MRRVVLAVAMAMFGSALGSSQAFAAEALLIRHEVLSVPVGSELELTPGFFIGKAWTADPEVANAGLTSNLRNVRFQARAPGRTIVSTWNLLEPNKRIEYEIVVVNEANEPMFPSPSLPQNVLSDAGETQDDDDTK